MASNLIAVIASPSGLYTAKVFSRPTLGDFRSVFFIGGVRQAYADAITVSWSEAMSETAHSLGLSDAMDAEALALRVLH